MWQTIKTNLIAFNKSFYNSGTIIFARLQVLLGVVFTVASATDLTPFLGNGKYLTSWLILSGVITEYTRKRGTGCLDGHLVPTSMIPPVVAPVPPVVLEPTDGTVK